MPPTDFRFEPPNRRRVWKNLSLTMSQAAALTGVSERQIQHWMDKGYLPPQPDGSRKIGGDSLDVILLVKQARQAGVPLRRAVALARVHLAHEGPSVLDSDMARWALQELRERLATARAGIETVEGMLDGAAPSPAPAAGRKVSRLTSNPVSSQVYD